MAREPSIIPHLMDKADWLAQISEPILEPDQEICDPHHHLWDLPKHRYLLDELLDDLNSGHRIKSTVYVECGSMYRAAGPESMQPVGETEFVNGIAAMSASGQYGDTRACAAIVGRANLCLGEAVGAVLDAHQQASPRFVGIRHASAWDASDDIRNAHTRPIEHLFDDAQFRLGLRELGRRNLTFDAWLFHPQIPDMTRLAQAFPDQLLVLDHFGGPLGIGPYAGRQQEVFANWKRDITALAPYENVVMKLGGLAMPLNGHDFHKAGKPATSEMLCEATRDYYLTAIDLFGPQRCMFESNFPVDKASCSYHVLWNSFKRMTQGFSDAEKTALFHDTAARVYRINE